MAAACRLESACLRPLRVHRHLNSVHETGGSARRALARAESTHANTPMRGRREVVQGPLSARITAASASALVELAVCSWQSVHARRQLGSARSAARAQTHLQQKAPEASSADLKAAARRNERGLGR